MWSFKAEEVNIFQGCRYVFKWFLSKVWSLMEMVSFFWGFFCSMLPMKRRSGGWGALVIVSCLLVAQ